MRKQFILIFLLVMGFQTGYANGDSWNKIVSEGKGVVKFYWYPNNVIIANSRDIIDGIEHDLAVSFVSYLEAMYNVDIELQWIETKSFDEVMNTVKDGSGGTFGASSISITPNRSRVYNFTEPYMADVAVLVSNASMPIALSESQLASILKESSAVSIRNTTLVESLQKLKGQLDITFDIRYVKNSGNIIDYINDNPNTFGYVDIANFLVAIESSSNVKRQFLFPVKLEGLAMVFPKNSDWTIPVNDYFNSARFQEDRQEIITKFLGSNATEIINRISKTAEMGPLEEIVLSNREKEAQYEMLLEAARKDQESTKLTTILSSIIAVALVVILLVFLLYKIKSRNNEQLLEQQKMIEERNSQLRSINEEKNNLIQVLAHDLRSPISNILNGSQIIQERENLSDDGSKIIGFIIQSSEKLNKLIDKILDVDAIETGRHNVQLESFPIHQIISRALEDNSAKAKTKNITLSEDISTDLNVKADKVYTTQVIDNLLSNAIKYSDEETTVEISAMIVNDMIRISVKDQGPGLSEDDQKKIFRKYQRLSAKPTKGEESLGLGLSIVKLFTERMGGFVTFDTKLGQGTTFHVSLRKG
ncbi:ATP-binding protein [Ekhidna lutea]|nr:ATP-binding protein [Ekhidna lutea]